MSRLNRLLRLSDLLNQVNCALSGDRFTLTLKELWRLEDRQLRISLSPGGQYQDANDSPHFPNCPIVDGISQCLELTSQRLRYRSQTEGRSQTLKAFRQWVREFFNAHGRDRGMD